jgi:hypothetical protein
MSIFNYFKHQLEKQIPEAILSLKIDDGKNYKVACITLECFNWSELINSFKMRTGSVVYDKDRILNNDKRPSYAFVTFQNK